MSMNEWTGPDMAAAQWEVAAKELRDAEQGRFSDAWKVLGSMLADMTDELGRTMELLDVGCGVAAASRIIPHFAKVHYTGIDYNGDVILEALRHFPLASVYCCDATDMLLFGDDAFDSVVSSGSVNHIRDWPDSVKEMARVSRRWIVFHRLWVYHDATPSTVSVSQAYNQNVWRVTVNERELTGLLADCGFKLESRASSDGGGDPGQGWTLCYGLPKG